MLPPEVAGWASGSKGVTGVTENNGKMKLEEMRKALENYDAMLCILRKRMKEGTNRQATPEVIAQFQQWRDDLEARIGVEQDQIQFSYTTPGVQRRLRS